MLPPISDDEAALLRAVCLDPRDDLPRLVIADWYEERGQAERAEVIRAAVATADRDGDTPARGGWDLSRFASEYTVRLTFGWPGKLALTERRGWPELAVFGDWTWYGIAAAALFARVPAVRAQVLTARPQCRAYASRMAWTWVRQPPDRLECVPPGVFERLAGLASPSPASADADRFEYPNELAAWEALSRAMVDEGRAAAGLPPLAWPEFADPPG